MLQLSPKERILHELLPETRAEVLNMFSSGLMEKALRILVKTTCRLISGERNPTLKGDFEQATDIVIGNIANGQEIWLFETFSQLREEGILFTMDELLERLHRLQRELSEAETLRYKP